MTDENNKKNCPFCGEEILAVAVKCKHCQSDFSQGGTELKTKMENHLIGNLVVLIGSALLLLGLFLPWVTLGIISADAFTKAPDDANILLILGILIVILCIYSLIKKVNLGLPYTITSLICISLLGYIYFLLSDDLIGKQAYGQAPQIGVGFWLCVIGSVGMLIGALFLVQKRKVK